jgi:hypothetical protein
MAEIVSIKKLRENSNPDVFIETVLNSPARLERLRQNRERMAEQARKEAERKAEEAKRKEAFNSFVLRFAVGFSFAVAAAATYVALVF